jgi:hypothetical protein
MWMSNLVDETEAAKLLGNLSVKTLRRWRWQGCGPAFVKVGAAVRYQLVDIEAFLSARRRHSTRDLGDGRAE